MGSVSRWNARAHRHWVFVALLVGGTLLRVVTQIAYRPALLFIDSYRYLGNQRLNPTLSEPIGYNAIVLRPILWLGNLAAVAAVQHILGLAMAVAIYVLLLRLGTRRWLAAVAIAPLMFDAYQLQIEQNIMSDTLFEAMVVGVVVLLLWSRPPSRAALAVAGLLLGLAVAVRVIGGVLILPVGAFAFFTGTGGWRRLVRTATVTLAFALPLVAYAGYYSSVSGHFGLSTSDAGLLYGRAATIVRCSALDMPAYERALCPKEPTAHRLGVDVYAHSSPYPNRVQPPPGKTRNQVLREFAFRVFRHQPWDVANAVLTDFVKAFAWSRTTSYNDVPVFRWQFQHGYPTFGHSDSAQTIARYGGGGPSVIQPLATFLREYQLSVGFLPGPLLGLAFVAGLLGASRLARARVSGLRAACALPAFCGLSLMIAADFFEFSWRYQLPAFVLAPVAGAIGVTALTRHSTVTPAGEVSPTVVDEKLGSHGVASW